MDFQDPERAADEPGAVQAGLHGRPLVPHQVAVVPPRAVRVHLVAEDREGAHSYYSKGKVRKSCTFLFWLLTVPSPLS